MLCSTLASSAPGIGVGPACPGWASSPLSLRFHPQQAVSIIGVALLLQCCLQEVADVDSEQRGREGRALWHAITKASEPARLPIACSQFEAMVGEELHNKRHHMTIWDHLHELEM